MGRTSGTISKAITDAGAVPWAPQRTSWRITINSIGATMTLVDVPFSELHAKYGDSDDDTVATAAQETPSCLIEAHTAPQTLPEHEVADWDQRMREEDDGSYYPLREDEYNYWDVLSGDELDSFLEADKEDYAGVHQSTLCMPCHAPKCFSIWRLLIIQVCCLQAWMCRTVMVPLVFARTKGPTHRGAGRLKPGAAPRCSRA